MPTDKELRKGLPKLLGNAAAKRLERVFAAPIESRFEELAYLVKTIKGEAAWQADRHGALRSVIAEAIGELPLCMEASDRANYKGCPERQMALYLYGFRRKEILAAGGWQATDVTLSYRGDYRPAALAITAFSEDSYTSAEAIARIREDLADNLIQMLQKARKQARAAATSEAAPSRPPSVLASDATARYIERPEYIEKFKAARDDGSKVFLLYGDGGSGKTTLAKHYAALIADGRSIAFFRAHDNTLLSADLSDYLSHHEERGAVGDTGSLARAFALRLERGNVSAPVIIDDAQSWKTVELLLPADLACLTTHVIITSRAAILPTGAGSPLWIDMMSDKQATAMIRNRLSGISPGDVAILTAALDCRPLAIEHGCALIALGLTPSMLRDMLEFDPVTVIDSIRGDHKLTTIYRQIIKTLEDDADLPTGALPILDCLLLANGFVAAAWDVRKALVTSTIFWGTYRHPQSAIAHLGFTSGMAKLEHLSIVKTSENFGTPPTTIHPLTLSLLKRIRSTQIYGIALEYLSILSAELKAREWRPGRPLPSSSLIHSWAIRASVIALENDHSDESAKARRRIMPFYTEVTKLEERHSRSSESKRN